MCSGRTTAFTRLLQILPMQPRHANATAHNCNRSICMAKQTECTYNATEEGFCAWKCKMTTCQEASSRVLTQDDDVGAGHVPLNIQRLQQTGCCAQLTVARTPPPLMVQTFGATTGSGTGSAVVAAGKSQNRELVHSLGVLKAQKIFRLLQRKEHKLERLCKHIVLISSLLDSVRLCTS